MGWMEKIRRFMYGRNGFDAFSKGLLIFYFIFYLVSAVFHSYILYLLSIAVAVYLMFRVFSRNIYKRQRENEKFQRLLFSASAYFSKISTRVLDLRNHRYRKCRGCKKTLRLPRKKGKHTVICPVCGKKFKVRIIF